MKSARRVAYDALLDISKGSFAHLKIKQAASLCPQEAKFISSLVYTTLDNLIYIDFIIDSFTTQKPKLPVRCVLQLGACQLLYMNVPDSAACDESVKLVKEIGKGAIAGFVNAVLRSIVLSKTCLPKPTGSALQRLSINYSYPLWLVEILCERLGEEQAEQLIIGSKPFGTAFFENKFKRDTNVETALKSRGLEYRFGNFVKDCIYCDLDDVGNDPLFVNGSICMQSEASMLVCDVANPQKGMRVLDACSAPGGKSIRMASNMGWGSIHSWDIHPHRINLIQKNIERCGVPFVTSLLQDASVFVPELEESFDVVLVDAPCSGLGVIGSKPDIKYSKSYDIVQTLGSLQRSILSCCARYVRTGGSLIYSTCTIMKEENEFNIGWLLDKNRNMQSDDISQYLPLGFPKHRCKDGMVQLYPHLDGIDGFFISRLIKK